MDTEMLIGSRFEAGTEQEEAILNPRTGETDPQRFRRHQPSRSTPPSTPPSRLRHLVAHHAGGTRRLPPQARRRNRGGGRGASPISRR